MDNYQEVYISTHLDKNMENYTGIDDMIADVFKCGYWNNVEDCIKEIVAIYLKKLTNKLEDIQ